LKKIEIAMVASLSDLAYTKIKAEIAAFKLIPGDRFSENSLVQQFEMSRTPIREALFKLQQEGWVEVQFRSGWLVKPFDFDRFEHLYDLRLVLETAAVKRLADTENVSLDALNAVWLVPANQRLIDGKKVAKLDEAFHGGLIAALGNPEIARVHQDVTEQIRIIRRLDFTQPSRIEATYEEHGQILKAIAKHRADQANLLLRAHIETSKMEVRKMTLSELSQARNKKQVKSSKAR
jgi:DNA-binding GntR family transcriptional regulator